MTFTNALGLESGKALASNRTTNLPSLSAVSFPATYHVQKAGLVVGNCAVHASASPRWQPGCHLPDLSAECGSDGLQNGLVAIFRDVGGIDLDDQAPCPIL